MWSRFVILALILGASAKARAQPLQRPRAPRVLHVSTAYLLPNRGVHGSLGGTHRGAMFGALSVGLGGIAEIGLATDDDAGVCPSCGGDAVARGLSLPSAYFKIGVGEGRFHRLQPALALGFVGQLGTREVDGLRELRLARMYLAASQTIESARVHLGVDLWDGRVVTSQPVQLHDRRLGARVRPFAAIGWTPRIYPRTTLLGELAWVPAFRPDAVDLRWLAGWGARYQAFSWGSVELAVQHRARGTLDDSTVLIRANLQLF